MNSRVVLLFVAVGMLASFMGANAVPVPIPNFRPPAVPLIVTDPYLSIWLASDNLTDTWPTLWDGTIKAFSGLIRIDGTAYRFMGPAALGPPPMQQISVTVYPLNTEYIFQEAGIELAVVFTSPLVTGSDDLLSRPATYLTYAVAAYDGKTHDVQIYYDNSAEIAVNSVTENVVWATNKTQGGLFTMSIGTQAQNIFGVTGDSVGIDWGYFYVATNPDPTFSYTTNQATTARNQFISQGTLPAPVPSTPTPCNDNWPALALSFNIGTVGSEVVEKVLILAYDDIYSLDYFGTYLKSYWHQNFDDIYDLIDTAWTEYPAILNITDQYDFELLNILEEIGGEQYATLGALAFRQTVGGTKLTWNPQKNTTWYFMKEISSDGDVSTVDVIFPASPFFLFLNPSLLAQQLLPIFAYANNETSNPYSDVWAPHHLGTWPVANIQTNQQENMPIEETGNMILMVAAIAQQTQGYPEVLQNPAYWALLQQWGDYLITVLPDPGDQLCTDDFEGPTPHDANLAVKGILAIAAFGQLNELVGNTTAAQKYLAIAQQYAQDWIQLANPNNTDHYRLRYDQPGWSLKYNMLWQYILNLTVYPQSVMDMEMSFYLENLHPYGIPLDDRADFSKLDWQSWVAAMANNTGDFRVIINGIYQFAQYTPQRLPLTDWYFTTQPNQRGFQSRTVVGGLYAKALMAKILNS